MAATRDAIEAELEPRGLPRPRSLRDWLWAAAVAAGAGYAWLRFRALMDGYEVAILAGVAAALIVLGWAWRSLQPFGAVVAALGLFAVWTYGADYAQGERAFLLRYLLSSQSAIMWMSALFVLATGAYLLTLALRSPFTGRVATTLTWSAAAMGLTGLLVRWRESYLISPDFGHVPVSNLYEVFILFCVITALIHLHYEQRYRTRALGAFVMLVVSAAVGFLLWYSYSRGAHAIQPLVPALKSYWMKLHVPANFIGYGAFALAAMVAIAWLVRDRARPGGRLAAVLPAPELLDEVMYRAIALGFAFFTIATILGAVWAAEAWGGYWSWDPKETWALIVWLNYAAWLHMRLTKGWRGRPMAWWAIGGLLVTLFAFLGVNMFLSGLHSYGSL